MGAHVGQGQHEAKVAFCLALNELRPLHKTEWWKGFRRTMRQVQKIAEGLKAIEEAKQAPMIGEGI